MNTYVTEFLTEAYRPGLKKLISLVPVTNIKPGERGYLAEVVRVLQSRLEPYGLTIHQQYVSDWNSGRKIVKGGLDMQTTLALGIGCAFSSDIKITHAMTQLLLSGVWNPDVIPPKKLEALIAGGFVTTSHEQLDRIEDAITRIESPRTSPQKKLAQQLQDLLATTDYRAQLTDTLSASRVKRVGEIIEGMGAPLAREEWQLLALALADLTSDETWVYERVKSLVETLLGSVQPVRRLSSDTHLETEAL